MKGANHRLCALCTRLPRLWALSPGVLFDHWFSLDL
jgi:hypothetical protein